MNGDLLQLYRAVELFGGLTEDQINALAHITKQVTYQRGHTIIDQNDEGDQMFIIHSGQVEVSIRQGDSAHEQTKVYLGRGQVIGEIALIDQGKRSATVRAIINDTQVDVINRNDFEALCNSNTAIGYIVMRNLARDLAYKMRHINLESSQGGS